MSSEQEEARALRRKAFKRRFFSRAGHPVNVITNAKSLYRYQMFRLFAAVAGGALAAAGLGFSYSHASGFAPEWEVSVGLAAVVGMAVAVFFVVVPFPEAFKILTALAGAVVVFFVGLDTEVVTKILMTAAGLVVSVGLALVLSLLVRIGKGSWVEFRQGLAIAPWLAGTVVLLGTLGIGPPADAQVRRCDAENLTVTADGTTYLIGQDQEAEPIVVDVDGDEELIDVSIDSEIDIGTVTVQIVDTALIPDLFTKDIRGAVVWSGQIRDGVVEEQPIVIERRNGTYWVASNAHDVDLRVVAGEATYRATITDGQRVCSRDFVIRLHADPATTLPGRVALGSAAVGAGLFGASMLAEVLRLLRGTRPRTSRATKQSTPDLDTWKFMAHVELDEREVDPEKIELGNVRLRDVVGFRLAGNVTKANGAYNLPLHLALSPEAVKGSLGRFELHVDGETIAELSLQVRDGKKKPVLHLLKIIIDLPAREAESSPESAQPDPALGEPSPSEVTP